MNRVAIGLLLAPVDLTTTYFEGQCLDNELVVIYHAYASRGLKTIFDVRPVYHQLGGRIGRWVKGR